MTKKSISNSLFFFFLLSVIFHTLLLLLRWLSLQGLHIMLNQIITNACGVIGSACLALTSVNVEGHAWLSQTVVALNHHKLWSILFRHRCLSYHQVVLHLKLTWVHYWFTAERTSEARLAKSCKAILMHSMATTQKRSLPAGTLHPL